MASVPSRRRVVSTIAAVIAQLIPRKKAQRMTNVIDLKYNVVPMPATFVVSRFVVSGHCNFLSKLELDAIEPVLERLAV
jgi:hypothetical protein